VAKARGRLPVLRYEHASGVRQQRGGARAEQETAARAEAHALEAAAVRVWRNSPGCARVVRDDGTVVLEGDAVSYTTPIAKP
jgi:hypothetical protein